MPKKDSKLKALSQELNKVYDLKSIEELDPKIIEVCLTRLDDFTDSRQASKVLHKLSDIVMIVMFACFAAVDEWKEVEEFAYFQEKELKKYLDLPCGIPSHDTIQKVFSIVNPVELTNLLIPLFMGIVDNGIKQLHIDIKPVYEDQTTRITDIYAFDGKEIRKSASSYKSGEDNKNFNALNVYSTEYQLSLRAERIGSKTNEIPTMAKVLKYFNLSGIVATFDALNTQKSVIDAIVNARGEYVAVLKRNHETFYIELEEYFNDLNFLNNIRNNNDGYLKETEETKRKTVIREYFITDDIKWFSDLNQWNGLRTFGYEFKTIINNDTKETVTEKRYFLNSIKANVYLFSLAVRRHWQIENNLHWHLDVTFREDYLTTKNKNALHNMSIIRRFVLAVLNLLKESYSDKSLKAIRKSISWDFGRGIAGIFTLLAKLNK